MGTHTCTHNGITYSVDKLIKLSKNLPVHEQLVKDLTKHLRQQTWSDATRNKEVNISALEVYKKRDENADFKKHIERAMKADLKYPIILNNELNIVSDGVHRLLKAYILKKEYIKTVTFEKMPLEAIVSN